MKKVFISQPMNGLSDEEIRTNREAIINKLNEFKLGEFEIIDSYMADYNPEKNNPVAYLGKSIEFLAQADLAVFGKGWQNARGCQIEHSVCVAYNIPIIDEIGV